MHLDVTLAVFAMPDDDESHLLPRGRLTGGGGWLWLVSYNARRKPAQAILGRTAATTTAVVLASVLLCSRLLHCDKARSQAGSLVSLVANMEMQVE